MSAKQPLGRQRRQVSSKRGAPPPGALTVGTLLIETSGGTRSVADHKQAGKRAGYRSIQGAIRIQPAKLKQ